MSKYLLSHDRNAIRRNAIVGIAVQAIRPTVSLVTLPLLLGHLGVRGLGVWMIALSLMGMISFFSAGLSASVVTAIGRARGSAQMADLSSLTTSAVFIGVVWGIFAGALIVPVAFLVNWTTLINLPTPADGIEFAKLLTVIAAILPPSLAAVVTRQVMEGQMHGYISQGLDLTGTLLGAAALISAIYLKAQLWVLGLAFLGPPLITTLVGGLVYLRQNNIRLVTPKHLDRTIFWEMSRNTARMAGYQAAYAVSSQSDLLLIGALLGTPASATYGVAQRVFSLPILISTAINYAQWPALARADAAGDIEGVSRTFRNTLLVGTIFSLLAALAIAYFYQPLLTLWLGHTLYTDQSLLAGMVVWVVTANIVNTMDVVLRARNESKLLMRAMVAMAFVNISATLLLIPLMGGAGAIWGSVSGFILTLLLPYSIKLRQLLRKQPAKNAQS